MWRNLSSFSHKPRNRCHPRELLGSRTEHFFTQCMELTARECTELMRAISIDSFFLKKGDWSVPEPSISHDAGMECNSGVGTPCLRITALPGTGGRGRQLFRCVLCGFLGASAGPPRVLDAGLVGLALVWSYLRMFFSSKETVSVSLE